MEKDNMQEKEEPIRILQVVPNMNSGGIENFIMNVYRNIDRSKVQFDFLVHYQKESFFDKEIEALGGKIYRFSVNEDYNLVKYYIELNKFFKQHKEYKVVHGHMASLGFLYLGAAKKNKVPVRIAHSHGTSHLKTLKGYLKYFMFKTIKYKSNVNWACSTEAGKYLFKKRKFELIPNAIDMQKFSYNPEIREKKRKELGIEGKFVIGNVGRFNLQKNHKFVLEIFKEIKKKEKNAVLLLVGEGELRERIREQIKELKLEEDVMLLGVRKDTNELYQTMDVFLLPSLFEGLPVTGIEAQTSLLKCYFSDEITKEVKITENIHFVSLDKTAEQWAKEILENKDYNRQDTKIISQQFDIKVVAKELERKYQEYYESEK